MLAAAAAAVGGGASQVRLGSILLFKVENATCCAEYSAAIHQLATSQIARTAVQATQHYFCASVLHSQAHRLSACLLFLLQDDTQPLSRELGASS